MQEEPKAKRFRETMSVSDLTIDLGSMTSIDDLVYDPPSPDGCEDGGSTSPRKPPTKKRMFFCLEIEK